MTIKNSTWLMLFIMFSSVHSMQSLKTMFCSCGVTCYKPKVHVVEVHKDSDYKKVYDRLFEVGKDSSIDAVIVEVDRDADSYTNLCPVVDMIKAVSIRKPTITLIQGEAIGIGYLMACAGDYVIAHSKTSIGGLGVSSCIQKNSNLSVKREDGVNAENATVDIVQVGKFKTVWMKDSGPLTQEHKEYINEYNQSIHNAMVDMIVKWRNLDKKMLSVWADGKMFLASKALEVGLIDKIGTLYDAESEIVKLLKKRYPNKQFSQDIELIFPKKDEKDDKKEATK